jgi:hypothetical protein
LSPIEIYCGFFIIDPLGIEEFLPRCLKGIDFFQEENTLFPMDKVL